MDSTLPRHPEGGPRVFGWRAALAENERIADRVGTHDRSIRDTLSSVGASAPVTQCVSPGSGLAALIAHATLAWVLVGITVLAIACLATGGHPQLLLPHARW